jgi:hypothetical protein
VLRSISDAKALSHCRAADHLHCLLREKGSYQKLARDSGAIPAIVKMERRESTKELLQWLVRC